MVSLETIGEQFAELGIEPAPAILGRCKIIIFPIDSFFVLLEPLQLRLCH